MPKRVRHLSPGLAMDREAGEIEQPGMGSFSAL